MIETDHKLGDEYCVRLMNFVDVVQGNSRISISYSPNIPIEYIHEECLCCPPCKLVLYDSLAIYDSNTYLHWEVLIHKIPYLVKLTSMVITHSIQH